MSLIDNTYFVGDIALPNLNEITNSFDDVRDRYETEILKKLLGYQLYDEFITAIAGTPEQKWINLKDGVEFTFEYAGQTITQKWNGLINSDLISLISYYVYYMYRNENLSTTTSINDVIGIPENATRVDDAWKVVNAWNRGHGLYGDIRDITSISNTRLLEFDKFSSTYIHYNDKPSAYNFLLSNRDDYDNWIFEPIGRLNVFGI